MTTLTQAQAEQLDAEIVCSCDFGSIAALSGDLLADEIAHWATAKRPTDAGVQWLAALRYEQARRGLVNHSAIPADIERINAENRRRRLPDSPYRSVFAPNGDLVVPQWGVGYGGQGTWLNRHFATLAEAEAFYAAEVASTRQSFGRLRVQETEVKNLTATITKQTTIVNVKKAGTIGKIRQTVRIYAIVIPGFPSIFK